MVDPNATSSQLLLVAVRRTGFKTPPNLSALVIKPFTRSLDCGSPEVIAMVGFITLSHKSQVASHKSQHATDD